MKNEKWIRFAPELDALPSTVNRVQARRLVAVWEERVAMERGDRWQAIIGIEAKMFGGKALVSRKLINQITVKKLDSGYLCCRRFGCVEGAALLVHPGTRQERALCETHVLAMVGDLIQLEEREHTDGLAEFCQMLVELLA